MLKLNYPHLGIGRGSRVTYDTSDRVAVQNTLPVVDSICHSAQQITSSGHVAFLGPLVPTFAHSMFLAAKLLMAFAGASAQGPEWPSKVQLLRNCLEVFAKRWKIAGACLKRMPAMHASRWTRTDFEMQNDTYRRSTQPLRLS